MQNQSNEPGAGKSYLPRPERITAEFMTELLSDYYQRKWNTNESTVKMVARWKNWPVMLRMPDIMADFTVMIDDGRVASVTPGTPDRPRIMSTLLAETMVRIYYEETTMAIEAIAGRVKVRGDETEKRRLLGALSYLTW